MHLTENEKALSLSNTLRLIGLTHARDWLTDTDGRHTLRNADGPIGRYDAHEAWELVEGIKIVEW